MGRAEKLFYRTCLRTLDGFKSLRIPFTGVYGTCLVNWSLDSQESVRHWCKSGVQGLNSLQGGFDQLPMFLSNRVIVRIMGDALILE